MNERIIRRKAFCAHKGKTSMLLSIINAPNMENYFHKMIIVPSKKRMIRELIRNWYLRNM